MHRLFVLPKIASQLRPSSSPQKEVSAKPCRIGSVSSLALFVAALLPTVSGCGGVLYTSKINSVEAKVERAKEVGAEQSAPYEYYSAQARVEKAKEEAARADYQDAIDLLDEAETFADKAVDQAGAVRHGAGR